ncbi:MAG: saccharopine dehydrogenase NADP-binding domain-containing protein [Chloroflexota bacterium]
MIIDTLVDIHPKRYKVLILGSGKIGLMIATLLTECREVGPTYEITIADQNEMALNKLSPTLRQWAIPLDVTDSSQLTEQLTNHDVVINALPYYLTSTIATAAAATTCHYLDLTEDVKSTEQVRTLAENAGSAFIPQCGLAPGYISIVGYHMTQGFDTLRDLYLRVGALPKYPSNALKYNLTWSTDGLVNEYLHPCDAIVMGTRQSVAPLEALSEFSLDGIRYESFNTSGGLGSLCDTLEGKVSNLNYQSVRYPGHQALMRALIQDLRLGERPKLLKDILEYAIPATMQDVVLVYVSVSGEKKGRLLQETYSRKIYSRQIAGERWSAIQVTTASAVCAVLDLLCNGTLPQKGFIKQEDISFEAFIQNRFGRNYHYAAADEKDISLMSVA